ncbi:MAG: CpsD/CapB family tyrosine-protein kinase [Deltaproteobacteria bacterium]|nr:CpsD/CapB family tyrosine-protein kinase [Deltaproteobacteria bacterium]
MNDILKKAMERTEREGGKKPPEDNPAAMPTDNQPVKAEKNEVKNQAIFNRGIFAGSPGANKKNQGKARTKKTPHSLQSLNEYKIIYDCRIHPASDKVKILRTQMLQRLHEIGGKSVLITSPRPGEGKTVNAINVAISIAQEVDRTVILIDANLRKPAVHKYFGLEDGLGLADYLLGKASIEEILINPGIDKLTIMPGGHPLATSSEMLGAARMSDLVKEMKGRYADRILVFDGPDILTNADSQVFARLVDGIVMVVEAEKTARTDVLQAMELIGDTPLIGTIFNKSHE